MAILTIYRAGDAARQLIDVAFADEPVRLVVEPEQAGNYEYAWELPDGATLYGEPNRPEVFAFFNDVQGQSFEISATLYTGEGLLRTVAERGAASLTILPRPLLAAVRARAVEEPIRAAANDNGFLGTVALRRTNVELTDDVALWLIIRYATDALSFKNYQRFMDLVLCRKDLTPVEGDDLGAAMFMDLLDERFLPFNDTDAYRFLKVATEAFMMVAAGVKLDDPRFLDDLLVRLGTHGDPAVLWKRYLQLANGTEVSTLPYLDIIRRKLSDLPIKTDAFAAIRARRLGSGFPEDCFGILREKLTQPLFIELIWSYWHEEGMLVQSLNAISRRFQNVRAPAVNDPLAALEIDSLRPLNNLLWGYVQDEQHRLTVVRRAHEYLHHYGFSLVGRAVPNLRPADTRPKFLEGFHNLLHLATIFFQQDDDTTVVADGFPLLNGLREVHLELSRGAHNQFGDLPSTARQEMLLQQWLLARPEFREFLPTRIMVAYPEPWMDRVDAMKTIQGWSDTSVMHFHNLGVYGEQLLLSIRYGAWTRTDVLPLQAANWARYWRAEIQGYIHAYRAVTSIDLSADITDSQRETERYAPPSSHLQRQLDTQRQGRGLPAPSSGGVPVTRRQVPSR
jgi:hypothetical protein